MCYSIQEPFNSHTTFFFKVSRIKRNAQCAPDKQPFLTCIDQDGDNTADMHGGMAKLRLPLYLPCV
jgi:hypothetical protein